MSDVNVVTVSGRLTRDPEVKEKFVKVGIANNIWVGEEHVNFLDCILFGSKNRPKLKVVIMEIEKVFIDKWMKLKHNIYNAGSFNYIDYWSEEDVLLLDNLDIEDCKEFIEDLYFCLNNNLPLGGLIYSNGCIFCKVYYYEDKNGIGYCNNCDYGQKKGFCDNEGSVFNNVIKSISYKDNNVISNKFRNFLIMNEL